MNTIEDLRATLREHADASLDDAALARRSAVHQRVAVVRRRRRAAVAGAVAAVVAVVGGVAVLPRWEAAQVAAQRRLAGAVAPATWVTNGYRYAFARGVESRGEERLDLSLQASDEPRLVSWAVTGGPAELTLPTMAGDSDTHSVSPAAFVAFDYVAPGLPVELSLQVDRATSTTALAFAVYDLDGVAEPALETHGLVFRETAAEEALLGAVAGDPGQTRLHLPFQLPTEKLRLTVLCASEVKGASVQVTMAGELVSASQCGDSIPFDPGGAGGLTFSRPLAAPGTSVTFTAQLTRSLRSDEPLDDPAVRIALAAYAVPHPGAIIAGSEVPFMLEEDGHRWRLGSSLSVKGSRLEAELPPARGPVLLITASAGMTDSDGTLTAGGRTVPLNMCCGGRASSTAGVVWPDADRRVVMTALGSRALGLAWYALDDPASPPGRTD